MKTLQLSPEARARLARQLADTTGLTVSVSGTVAAPEKPQ